MLWESAYALIYEDSQVQSHTSSLKNNKRPSDDCNWCKGTITDRYAAYSLYSFQLFDVVN